MNTNRITVGWGVFFVFLFIYRCSMSVIGEVFVVSFTSLGDASRYQSSNRTIIDIIIEFNAGQIFDRGRVLSTAITDNLGSLFRLVFFGNPILIDFGFQTIAFIGIFKFLTVVQGETRRYLALMMLTPSFSLWSSIAGKEALVVFFVGILCAYFVKLYRNEYRFGPLEIMSTIGVGIFKIQYIPALAVLFFVVIVCKKIEQKVALAAALVILSLAPLFLFKEKIDTMAFNIIPHFLNIGSSRDAYWIEKYDVFYKAPYGMFQGFFGPTLNESYSGPLQFASFLESTIIVGVLILVLLSNIHKLPVFSLSVGFCSLGWLLFASYPLGIMNAGSAIRYRTGHLLLVVLIFTVVFSRERYVDWLGRNPDQGDVPRTPA
jgi:hypothetical protein